MRALQSFKALSNFMFDCLFKAFVLSFSSTVCFILCSTSHGLLALKKAWEHKQFCQMDFIVQ